jgi:hypothetical protein
MLRNLASIVVTWLTALAEFWSFKIDLMQYGALITSVDIENSSRPQENKWSSKIIDAGPEMDASTVIS